MVVMMNGYVVGVVDAREYAVKTLEEAGFTVIVK